MWFEPIFFRFFGSFYERGEAANFSGAFPRRRRRQKMFELI
jgi:hypothetical protein